MKLNWKDEVMRYTEIEASTLNTIVDLSMTIARKNLPTVDDDDILIYMIYSHWNQVLEQKADIHELSDRTKEMFDRFIINSGMYIRSLDEDRTEEEYLSTQYEMCTCEKCNELALSSNDLFLIMEDDTSELFVCMSCVDKRSIELSNTTCQVCERTEQKLELVSSIDEETGDVTYQRTCSICIEMFNLDVVDYS